MNAATRDRVLDLLVDEHYARALAAGHVIRNPGGWRTADRAATERQAAATSGWLQQQADRLLGEVKRPGNTATCPACGITFDPAQPDLGPLEAPTGHTVHEHPTRAADGLLYCRPSCAAGDQAITLDQWLAANPAAAGPGRFMRRYIETTAEGERLARLAPIDADQTRL